MLRKLLIFGLLAFAFCALAAQETSAATLSDGRSLISQAQADLENANMKAAERHLDQAIKILQKARVPKGANDDLAQACYLKANIMLARKHKAADLERLLTKAVEAAPDYTPDKALTTDPRLAPVYRRVLERHLHGGRQAIEEAKARFQEGAFCAAAELLMPHRNDFGAQRQFAEELLSAAQNLCDAPPPPRTNGHAATGLTAAGQAPDGAPPLALHCGVMPVTVRNLPGRTALSTDFSMPGLKTALGPLQSRLHPSDISPIVLESWRTRHDVANLREFLVRPGITTFGWSLADLLKGKAKGIDPAFSALPKRNATALEELMHQEGLSHVLFVFVEAVPKAGANMADEAPDVDIYVNLFARENIRKPIVTLAWRGISEMTARGRFSELGQALAEELPK